METGNRITAILVYLRRSIAGIYTLYPEEAQWARWRNRNLGLGQLCTKNKEDI